MCLSTIIKVLPSGDRSRPQSTTIKRADRRVPLQMEPVPALSRRTSTLGQTRVQSGLQSARDIQRAMSRMHGTAILRSRARLRRVRVSHRHLLQRHEERHREQVPHTILPRVAHAGLECAHRSTPQAVHHVSESRRRFQALAHRVRRCSTASWICRRSSDSGY